MSVGNDDAVGDDTDDAICQPVGDEEGNDAAGDDAICQPETVYNNSCHKEGDDDAVGLVNNRSKLKPKRRKDSDDDAWHPGFQFFFGLLGMYQTLIDNM